MSETMENQGEQCQRCKEYGEDRRTLWHACFYEMMELGLPFERVAIEGTFKKFKGKTEVPGRLRLEVPTFQTLEEAQAEGAKSQERQFYNLRVCKRCRSDWMSAIQEWFNTLPVEESCGSGIFVRRQGALVEISEKEWARLNPGREPVRVKSEE